MFTQDEIIQKLAEDLPFLRSKFQVIELGIFGSYARAEQTKESDLDLLVEFEEDTTNLFDLKYELRGFMQDKFGMEVDIGRKKYLKSYVRDQILAETIYVTEG